MSLKKTLLLGALLLWVAGVSWGFALVLRYEGTPGAADLSPARLAGAGPGRSKVLIMLAHPRCPCTRASLAELDRIMTRWHGRIEAHVWFLQPSSLSADFSRGSNWDLAAALPGVQVHADVDGGKAKELGALTSGHVVLFDEDGDLLFSGGITAGRGHQGDNPGCHAVFDLLGGDERSLTAARSAREGPPGKPPFPVFGCPLFESRSNCCEDSSCSK